MPARHTRSASARSAAALAFALLMGVSGLLSDPAAVTAMARPGDGPTGVAAWLSLASSFASFVPRPLLNALTGTQSISTGNDGRLTVLLLGSDTRATGFGRTDVIMIASLSGNTINVASIPRDTAKILNPFTASPTDVFKGKVNTILARLKVPTISNDEAIGRLEYIIEQTLDIEIDYHALVTFRGFEALVDEVDPIYINISRVVRDPRFQDDPKLLKGLYFPAAANYELVSLPYGPLCNGLWKYHKPSPTPAYWCHRALPFVRSRKGAGNSDFTRARRQQDFVNAALRAVINRGSGDALSNLVGRANTEVAAGHLYTNIPFNADALALFNTLYSATLGNQVVFCGPCGGYATRIGHSTSWRLNLPAVRSWAATYLK